MMFSIATSISPSISRFSSLLIILYGLLSFLWAGGCSSNSSRDRSPEAGRQQVRTGAEVLLEDHLDRLKGKSVGLVINPTARVGDTHLLDTLLARGVNVTALFAPEHGIRGEAGAGEVIRDGRDQATGLPVYSLYGKTRKPTPAMLEKVDLLVFDMQDVGARFYTYYVTLGLVLEAATDNSVPVWVLDRPNPAGGNYVAGWMLRDKYKSFVGAYPIPMAHGMTLGELAKMMVGEGWLDTRGKPDLEVIAMEGWERSMKWPDTGLQWRPPSPNLPTFEHAYLYLGTVLFEGTNISEGRGTDHPFLTIGAPFVSLSDRTVEKLNRDFPAVEIEKTVFIPRSIPGKAPNPKFEGEKCRGVRLRIINYDRLDPVRFGLRLLDEFLQSADQAETIPYIYKLAGSDNIETFEPGWEEEVEKFKQSRSPYLIY